MKTTKEYIEEAATHLEKTQGFSTWESVAGYLAEQIVKRDEEKDEAYYSGYSDGLSDLPCGWTKP